MRKTTLLILGVLLLTSLALVVPVRASLLDDVIHGVQKLFGVAPAANLPTALTVDSAIVQDAVDDINKNGMVDAGEVVTFSFTITNPADDVYTFSTLKTNVAKEQLNFIHDIRGTASLDVKDGMVTIPNLTVGPGQILPISFKARVNYDADQDISLTAEPELIDKDAHSLVKAVKKEVKAKKILQDKIPSNLLQRSVR